MPCSTVATPYGYRTTITGPVTVDEALRWYQDIRRIAWPAKPFAQLVDLRASTPAGSPAEEPEDPGTAAEIQSVITEAMRYVRARGMIRSACVVSDPVIREAVSRLAEQTGMAAWERYFDSSTDPDWEVQALRWVEDGVEPGS
jgi:hypothetical protein